MLIAMICPLLMLSLRQQAHHQSVLRLSNEIRGIEIVEDLRVIEATLISKRGWVCRLDEVVSDRRVLRPIDLNRDVRRHRWYRPVHIPNLIPSNKHLRIEVIGASSFKIVIQVNSH